MTATYEPCPTCEGLGHKCKDEDPFGHIHEHASAESCKRCEGRGSVPIEEPIRSEAPEEPGPSAVSQE